MYCATVAISHAYGGQIIDVDAYGDSLILGTDTVITTGTNISFTDIYFQNSAHVQNHGNITGTIHICDDCDIHFSNSGQISANFVYGTNATLTQIVRTPNDTTNISNSATDYAIHVSNARDINLNELYKIGQNTTKITIHNSELLLTAPTTNTPLKPPIELSGENTIKLEYATLSDIKILANVIGDGTIGVIYTSAPPLYTATTYVKNGDVWLHMTRETDYAKILKNKTGNFLNKLRINNPQDRLLQKLDAATSMPQIEHTLHNSMRINTDKLKYPLRTISNHLYSLDNTEYTTRLYPFLIRGSNIDSAGIYTGMNLRLSSGAYASFGIASGTMYFSDTIDDFEGEYIGAGASAEYDISMAFVRLYIDITKANIKAPLLITGSHDAQSILAHAGLDIGKRFNITKSLTFSPFVGISQEYAHVFNSAMNYVAHAGIKTGHTHTTTDIRYDYNLQFVTDSINTISVSASIGATSVADAATVYFSLGALRDTMGISYKLSLSAAFDF